MATTVRKENVNILGKICELRYIKSDNPDVDNNVHVQVYSNDGKLITTAEDKNEAIKETKEKYARESFIQLCESMHID